MNKHKENALAELDNLRNDILKEFLILADIMKKRLEGILETGIDNDMKVCLADTKITDENLLYVRISRESAQVLLKKVDDLWNFEDFMNTISSQEKASLMEYSVFPGMVDCLKKDYKAMCAKDVVKAI